MHTCQARPHAQLTTPMHVNANFQGCMHAKHARRLTGRRRCMHTCNLSMRPSVHVHTGGAADAGRYAHAQRLAKHGGCLLKRHVFRFRCMHMRRNAHASGKACSPDVIDACMQGNMPAPGDAWVLT
eukprot:358298-Chlamydomonas_euryale.AAC.8